MQNATEELPRDRIHIAGNVQVAARLPSVICASSPPESESLVYITLHR